MQWLNVYELLMIIEHVTTYFNLSFFLNLLTFFNKWHEPIESWLRL